MSVISNSKVSLAEITVAVFELITGILGVRVVFTALGIALYIAPGFNP